jgi:arginine decarboxylase
MIQRITKLLKRKVLIVDDDLGENNARGRAIEALADELTSQNLEVIQAASFDDGMSVIISDASLSCILVDWTIGNNDTDSHSEGLKLLREIRHRNDKVPIFLIGERGGSESFSLEAMTLSNEIIWILEDTSSLLGGRILVTIHEYTENLLPPFTKALIDYTENVKEYSWAAPGHQGGVAFTKSAAGREFFDYFGENLFRTDSGIERTSLGSLLDHEGVIKDSEEYIATVFGAQMSYNVLNGTSGSNRTIMSAAIQENQIALVDRNCHKSVEQGMVNTGGIPIFLRPTRNRFGIIGPIRPSEFTKEAIKQKIADNPLLIDQKNEMPVYAVVTNCTYDGMCYNAKDMESYLEKSVDRIHFDEAWYAYARFNPMYKDRYGMRGNPDDHSKTGPTIFVTHSTHKLLAALSQSSFIHIRNGRKPVKHSIFNESYMLQATTSPLYALVASNEMGAAIMDGPQGYVLTQEAIEEAIDFRQALAKIKREYHKKGDWFFDAWNAPFVKDPKSGQVYDFADAPKDLLAKDTSPWVLKPGDTWHGFADLQEDWCMLDPIKVGILCPGMNDDGTLDKNGIPAHVLSAFLYKNGIVPSRTTDFMVLCLFSIGVTKGKWGTLVNKLLEFKRGYDANITLSKILPDLAKSYPDRYFKMGLKDLCAEMFEALRELKIDKMQGAAFDNFPHPDERPRNAFQKLMSDNVELLPVSQLSGRTAAVGVIPYPPGIPIVFPGENFGTDKEPWLQYIMGLEKWNKMFPGFEKIIEGAELKDGTYHVWCLKK